MQKKGNTKGILTCALATPSLKVEICWGITWLTGLYLADIISQFLLEVTILCVGSINKRQEIKQESTTRQRLPGREGRRKCKSRVLIVCPSPPIPFTNKLVEEVYSTITPRRDSSQVDFDQNYPVQPPLNPPTFPRHH
jgi:hypothetical protein